MQVGQAETLQYDPLMPTVFHQPWWLTAATGGRYLEAVVTQSGRKIGSFPYVEQRVSGRHSLCGMPGLTRFLGPAVDEGPGAACNRVLRRAQVTRDLLTQVPGCSGFWQKLHRNTLDTLVYQELGYATQVAFTFEVAPASPEMLWRTMGRQVRAAIRQAEQAYRVRDLDDAALFAALCLDGGAAPGRAGRCSPACIRDVCRAAIEHGQGRIVAAEAPAGNVAAALFYAWDAQAAYCVMMAGGSGSEMSAISLLVWEAIQDAATRGLVFDLEGVLTPANALFLTGFGGQAVPRYVVSRFSRAHKLARGLRNSFAGRVSVA